MNIRRIEVDFFAFTRNSSQRFRDTCVHHGQLNDIFKALACSIHNLPENYPAQYWSWVILKWPELSFLVEDERGHVVGYVLSSIEPAVGDSRIPVGHINSLSVLRPYRRCGLAQKLMNLTKDAMIRDGVGVQYIQLHVRKSNRAAISLYDKLGYMHHQLEEKYYFDGEDALMMQLQIQSRIPVSEETLSSNVKRLPYQSWLTNFLYDKPRRFMEAAMALFRGDLHT